MLATSTDLPLVAFAVPTLCGCLYFSLSVGERGYQILFVCSTIFGFEMQPLLDATKMAKSLNLK